MALVGTRRIKGLGVSTAVLTASLAVGLMPGVAGAVHVGDYPGHIHAGSCAELGDVVFPLGNAFVGGLTAGMMGGTPEAGMEMGETMGSEDRVPVATSYTVVDAALDDILADEHAINYHESEENIENYIACGDLGGTLLTGAGMQAGGDLLIVGLRSVNDSGISGVATLEGMDDQTAVTIFLGEDLTGVEAAGAGGTPAATRSGETADEVAVEIRDFAYDPDPVTVPEGGTVTWTNRDGVPHTATGRNREALQSGGIAGGDAYSHTFDEAGTFKYFCEFHANMNGTVVVE